MGTRCLRSVDKKREREFVQNLFYNEHEIWVAFIVCCDCYWFLRIDIGRERGSVWMNV